MADLHQGERKLNRIDDFGRNEREIDFERAALVAADEMISHNPDFCLIAGDFLHDTHISSTSLNGVIMFCEKMRKAGIRLIVIGGNHDELETPDRFNMLHILHQHHGVELYLDQDQLDIAGVRLHLVSFRVLSRAIHGHGEVKPLDIAPDMPNVLVSHGYAPGPGNTSPPEEVEIPSEWLSDPRLDLICLGHIHHQGKVRERTFYSGAIERRGWGEKDEEPGFMIHTIAADGVQTQMIKISDLGVPYTPRPMRQVELLAESLTLDDLDRKVRKLVTEDVDGTILKVSISEVSSEFDRSKLRNEWSKLFREAGGFHLDIETRTERVKELLDVEFSAPPADLRESFHEYLSKQEIPEDQRPKLSALGAEILGAAHEKILAQETD